MIGHPPERSYDSLVFPSEHGAVLFYGLGPDFLHKDLNGHIQSGSQEEGGFTGAVGESGRGNPQWLPTEPPRPSWGGFPHSSSTLLRKNQPKKMKKNQNQDRNEREKKNMKQDWKNNINEKKHRHQTQDRTQDRVGIKGRDY